MLNPESIIAEIVLDHPECARVLQRHRIDFCCRGDRPLGQACAQRGLDTRAVLGELEATISSNPVEVELRALPTPALVEYIVERHHGYLREALPFVGSLAKKVARVHGEHNERLLELEDVVEELYENLVSHLDHEENELFPALLTSTEPGPELRADLDAMAGEHLEVGALLERVRAATEDYRIPDWACGSYRALFAELERMEGDVLRHVHAENHVLKPRYASAHAG